jgi:dynein heavy chain
MARRHESVHASLLLTVLVFVSCVNFLHRWKPPKWVYPNTEKLDFANLLVPTMDSTRAIFLIQTLAKQYKPSLLVGEPGTAKTSTALMFFQTQDVEVMLQKQVNFSSATVPKAFQDAIEADLEKRGGKNYGPPLGKRMTVGYNGNQ